MFGTMNLFCGVCGKPITVSTKRSMLVKNGDFGWLCSLECLKIAQHKYARFILGKEDDAAVPEQKP